MYSLHISTTSSPYPRALSYVGDVISYPPPPSRVADGTVLTEEMSNGSGSTQSPSSLSSPSSPHHIERIAHSPAAGSIFFAVQGQGAYARSLSMPLGAAYQVQVSPCPMFNHAAMCESAEASHGDRGTTERVYTSLQMYRGYVRLDGQCKHGVVCAGTTSDPPLLLMREVE